ncbi:hypothetical protein A3J90_05930 [candidate division WOR-1 bacterium RIFOXYC2_FULL_37_10]|nr:MAG: hypothetical protein A2246_05665 [candidate division WOR-1 bacterium RIFOXYA2_FULL_37_7]OGC34924.1 MAG: hypothetical protein A3J90_05930 [candidate division WOR-1 bacterium RIFOXYC2_FULL_37_10]
MINPIYKTYLEFARAVTRKPIKADEAVILLIRHGSTQFTTTKRIQRATSYDPLTSEGLEAASKLKKPLEMVGEGTRIFYSPSLRAIQTAFCATGRYLPVNHALFGLQDIDYGDFSGSIETIKTAFPNEYEIWTKNRINFVAPGGESYRNFMLRVRDTLQQNVLPQCYGHFGVVFAHTGTIREVLLWIDGAAIDNYKPEVSLTSVTAIRFSKIANPQLLLLNNTNHLGNDKA